MSDEHFIKGGLRDESEDRKAVMRFAEGMALKLYKNRHKAHWREATTSYLLKRLFGEFLELLTAIILRKDFEQILSECCDVALFAMMIADKLKEVD